MAAPDLIPPEQLARLWALLTDPDPDPDAIAWLIGPSWRPRLPAHPRRLRVVRSAGVVLVLGRSCRQ